tara:strand:+ start:55596 stop:56546 length:951 start_codon:yes stop_codon:yes gene_type:complete
MRLLFITSTRIGDAVLSSGLLGHFIDKSQGVRITVACGVDAAPLFKNLPGCEKVIPLRKSMAGSHWLLLWSKCALTPWDIVVDLRASAISWLLPTKKRLILKRHKNMTHRVVEIGALTGLKVPPEPRLWISPKDYAVSREFVPKDEFIVIAPTANWKGKQWRGDRFAQLARRITDIKGICPRFTIVVLGASSEKSAANEMLRSVADIPVIDLVGRTELMVSAAVISRSKFFVGNDSALMHIAAASGVPTLGLFGPSREENYAPWGPHCAFQRTKASYEELIYQPMYDHRQTDSLMDSLTVDMAEQAACDLWDRIKL